MKNRELFIKDPLKLELLNQGVSRVTNARDANEEKVARFELQTLGISFFLGRFASTLTSALDDFNKSYPSGEHCFD